MNVNEYAAATGVTPRRVRALIHSGALRAVRRGQLWEILDEPKRTLSRRPLSKASQQALATAVHQRTLAGLTGQSRARTAARIRTLRQAENPAELLADWWGRKPPETLNGGTSLVLQALHGNTDTVRERLTHRPTEYLRRWEDLAEVVSSERTIQGLTRAQLAASAEVDPATVTAIETARPVNSPSALRRVLRVLNIEPSALPPLDLR